MTWLLDTNACVALINGKPASVRARFESEIANGESLSASVASVFELWYGVAKSRRQDLNTRRVAAFLSGPIDILDLDSDDAHAGGEIRAALERAGTPIGPFDLLIAGQALRRGATVVTANTGEFARVPELRYEDWAT